MTPPGPTEEAWTVGQIIVWMFSSGGLMTALGGILWFARKDGQKDQALATLRTDLDGHIANDKAMFEELKADAAARSDKQDLRHEQNLRALGALPDKSDFRELRDTMTRQLEALSSLFRQRAQ